MKVEEGGGGIGGASPRRTQEYHINCLCGEGGSEVWGGEGVRVWGGWVWEEGVRVWEERV